MLIDLAKLSPTQAYFTLIQSVIPRPIAWVLSDSGNGSFNLAPFSFFNAICGDPPLILLSIGHKPDGTRKDTWVNIEQRCEFVVHIAGRDMAGPMVASSATLPHGESELERQGLATASIAGFRLPRLVGPRVALCCVKHAIHTIGNEAQGLIIGEVRSIYVDDDAALVRDGRVVIDSKKVDPLSRLGGNEYALFGQTMAVERPK
jgi:flavin reductase (DIM6/NTAB) family NADH-FMN oxidoreductase RutF